jgi:hypothetical protein
VCGASKSIGLHLHTPDVLFNRAILIRRLVLALTTRSLGRVGTEFLVRWMGWTCNRIGIIGGSLRGRLLGFRATDNNKTSTLLFAIENWPRWEGVLA